MSIVQKALIISLASLALAVPQAQLDRRQITVTPSPTFANTCRIAETSTAVSCLTRYTGLATSFCGRFAARTTSTTTITTNPTTTVTVSRYASTVFSATDVITNASTITSTSTLTQNYTVTNGQSTSFIPVEATTTITSYDYICSGETATPTVLATSTVLAQRQAVLPPRASCVSYLADYKLGFGINAACSCVVAAATRTSAVVETSTLFTGTTVTVTSTVRNAGVLTSGVTTITSRPLTTIVVTSIESRNATIPNVVPVITTTGTSYTTTTLTTATPILTTFRLTAVLPNNSSSSTPLYANAIQVNAGRALAFTPGPTSADDFTINTSSQLADNDLFLAVITTATPNDIPWLFWQSAAQVPDEMDILTVSACRGTLGVTSGAAGGDVFALCDGLDESRLLALGSRELFERNAGVCTVVDVRLDPESVDVGPGNATVTTFASTVSLPGPTGSVTVTTV